jgi:hypothetical protein
MRRLGAIVVHLCGFACGSVEDTTLETTPAPSVECPEDSYDTNWELVTLELAPQDDAAQCLRTEPADRIVVPFCINLLSGAGFRGLCDDAGHKYVAFISSSFIPPTGFRLCEETEVFHNRPCYTTCDEPTLGSPWLETICGEEETRVAGRCGELDSAYDENCCKRPFCFDGGCPTGMSCEDIYMATYVAIHQQLGGCRAGGPSFPMPSPICLPMP